MRDCSSDVCSSILSPGPLRLLHGRRGYGVVVVLWVLCALAATTWLIEAGGRQVPDRDIPADISTLRLRPPGLLVGRPTLRVLPLLDGGGVLVVLPPATPRARKTVVLGKCVSGS